MEGWPRDPSLPRAVPRRPANLPGAARGVARHHAIFDEKRAAVDVDSSARVTVQFSDSESVQQIYSDIARGKEILYLTRSQIESLGYTQTDVMKLVRTSLTEHGKKMVEMPAKIGIHPIYNTFHHAMPAFVPAANASGMKWVACFPDNYKYKLDQASALIILNDIQTGWPLAIMDGTWITTKRTAAVSAIAVEKLAHQDSSEIGILGCGVQGQEHLVALAIVMTGLKKVEGTFDYLLSLPERLFQSCGSPVPRLDLTGRPSLGR